MAMVRKQLYLPAAQQQKLCKLADQWNCTQAEVIRRALDCLPDPDASIVDRLAAAGVLVPPPADDDSPADPDELDALEKSWEAWVDAQPKGLGLSEAVLEDRR
jgi:hypothetical protein